MKRQSLIAAVVVLLGALPAQIAQGATPLRTVVKRVAAKVKGGRKEESPLQTEILAAQVALRIRRLPKALDPEATQIASHEDQKISRQNPKNPSPRNALEWKGTESILRTFDQNKGLRSLLKEQNQVIVLGRRQEMALAEVRLPFGFEGGKFAGERNVFIPVRRTKIIFLSSQGLRVRIEEQLLGKEHEAYSKESLEDWHNRAPELKDWRIINPYKHQPFRGEPPFTGFPVANSSRKPPTWRRREFSAWESVGGLERGGESGWWSSLKAWTPGERLRRKMFHDGLDVDWVPFLAKERIESRVQSFLLETLFPTPSRTKLLQEKAD
jgi:hypothetical protein